MKYLYDRDAPTDVDALTITVKEVWNKLDREGYIAFDLTEIKDFNPIHCAVMLRALWFCRDVIKGHAELIEACKEQCIKDGIDYTDALAGLYD